MIDFSRITACEFDLLHCPDMSLHYGSTPCSEKNTNPDSNYLRVLEESFRSFSEAVSYPANQAFIGNLDPLDLPERPWNSPGTSVSFLSPDGRTVNGDFGSIVNEEVLLELIKESDCFDLVLLAKGDETAALQIDREIEAGALPLYLNRKITGCVKSAHPDDINLSAHVILENLASKAGAVLAVRNLLKRNDVDPLSIDYIIETSEEACGDANQRGGGNFAKAIGELAGLQNATGSDTRSFCAAPVHGLLQAASLVRSGTFKKVIVAAGGTTAKLAMNSKKHIEKGFPVLEDAMGAFAVLIEAGESAGGGIIIRNDITGIHRIGSGSSPQNVIQNLVADPLEKAGMTFAEVGYYAPELHNPEVTEAGGAGNVTLANLKMIAAMAVMKKQIERTDINDFVNEHGSSGWAPTQGHIPSGVPALGWIARWFESGRINNAMIIGKGSLFLGRMTGLFDGVSILLESSRKSSAAKPAPASQAKSQTVVRSSGNISFNIGLTIPGCESAPDELYRGAAEAMRIMSGLGVKFFGDAASSPEDAQSEMERALKCGDLDGAVTFHYPFALGTATVGHTKAPGNGRDLFIASTTGISDTDRVSSLVKNTIAGIAAAKAWGIAAPSVGILNLDGARTAISRLKRLRDKGYLFNLVSSVRGEELLRGNDILAGTADVVVCDTLSGNAFIKLLGGYSAGGKTEVCGSGYGPGIGGSHPLVNIISRASSAAVVANALLYTARMSGGGLLSVYAEELTSARAAGLSGAAEEDAEQAAPKAASKRGGPDVKIVNKEIEGIDVLKLDEAVELLKAADIYCKAGMGCTGPVVMVAAEDAGIAKKMLSENGFID